MYTPTTSRLLATVAILLVACTPVRASCGATSCTLMTDRFAEAGSASHPGWSFDLRLEHVAQQRLRRGSRDATAADLVGEEAIERRTRSTALLVTAEYGFAEAWSVAVRTPLVHREHLHDTVDEDTGAIGASQSWRFTRPGDAQVLLRHAAPIGEGNWSRALWAGLRLPTGVFDVRNRDGVEAERSLQPGTGTTDLMLGLAARGALGMADALIVQAEVSRPLAARAGFRPGTRIGLAGAWSHAFSHEVGSIVQLNLAHRGADAGPRAEPELSGATTLDLSPGVTLATGPAATVYAYLQIPLVQRVRGVQLAPRNAIAVGWTMDL